MSQTILYIEDNENNVDLVKAIAESAGYRILTAFDGKEGIEIAIAESPDLIVCDYHLPYMNGLDVVRKLRANDSTKNIPIMMLTADLYSYPDSLEVGVDDYLNKPIRRQMFLNRVNRILNPHQDSDF